MFQSSTLSVPFTLFACSVQDEMVSRTHAKLVMKDCKFHIVDLGSINGTCINNVRSLPPHCLPWLKTSPCQDFFPIRFWCDARVLLCIHIFQSTVTSQGNFPTLTQAHANIERVTVPLYAYVESIFMSPRRFKFLLTRRGVCASLMKSRWATAHSEFSQQNLRPKETQKQKWR